MHFTVFAFAMAVWFKHNFIIIYNQLCSNFFLAIYNIYNSSFWFLKIFSCARERKHVKQTYIMLRKKIFQRHIAGVYIFGLLASGWIKQLDSHICCFLKGLCSFWGVKWSSEWRWRSKLVQTKYLKEILVYTSRG